MAIQTLNTIKNWFKTGLKPTQQQFWDTWDSFRHKFEKIPLKDIENLEQTLNEKAEKSQLDLHTNNQLAHAVLFTAKEDKNQKGIAGGYAPLNNFTKLASQYLDIINDLVSGGTDSILSAEQGKILQNQIDGIHNLLQSDNVNLDTLQEIVNAIGEIELSLNTILVNDLTTGGATKALTAEMGKLLQSSKEDKSQKGVSGGYAPLNNFTKLASQYLDIVNDLVSGGSTSLLSAEQGKILQNQINVINSLLASDDINLDTLQEIVNAIKDIQGLSTIIVNDLTAGGTDKALSAQMGKNLNEIKANLSGAAFTGAVSGLDPVNGNEFVTKQFAEGLLIGVVRFIAYYNPNNFSNQYPSSEGSGTGGAIRKGDTWVVSGLGVGVTTTIGTKVVQDGDRVSAMANTPAQDETKWSIGEANIGYTPANDASVLHRTGDETISGIKSIVNSSTNTSRLSLQNSSASTTNILSVGNSSTTNAGLRVTPSTGSIGAEIVQYGVGSIGLKIEPYNNNPTSNANMLILSNKRALNNQVDTARPLIILRDGLTVSSINDFGDMTGNSFIKSGGTATQFLKADGSVDSNIYAVDSNVVHKTGNIAETITGAKTINSSAGSLTLNTNANSQVFSSIITGLGAIAPSFQSYNSTEALRVSSQNGTGDALTVLGNHVGSSIVSIVNNAGIFSFVGKQGSTNTFTVSGIGNIVGNGLNLTAETASTIASFDSSKNVKSLPVSTYPSLTELTYLKGVTSSIQTQLNLKQNSLSNPITGTGTTNFLPKFTGANSLGNSLLSDDGATEVQIRTNANSSYGFLNKTATALSLGAFLPGTGFQDVSFVGTGGIDNVIFKANGNVGIGTTTPISKLDVESGIQTDTPNIASAGAYLKGVDVGLAFGQFDASSGYNSWMQSIRRSDSQPFKLSINPNGGFVGIGVPNPQASLHVSNSSESLRLQHDNAYMSFYDSPGNRSGYIQGASTGEFTIMNELSGNLGIGTSGAVRVAIDADGNVGIGGSTTGSIGGYTNLVIGQNDSGGAGLIKFRSTYNSGNGAQIYQGTNGTLFFDANTAVNTAYITANGLFHASTIEATASGDITGNDLNALTSVGFFKGREMINAPLDSSEWWYVTNENHGTGWRKQTATSYGGGANTISGGTTYIRVFTDNANWSSWRQLAFV